MPLHPHLHLLIPSSSTDITLEARLYLPPAPPSSSASTPFSLVTSASSSSPLDISDAISSGVVEGIRQWGVERLITASHPWSKLGGNMLFPVISHHLVSAAISDTHKGARTAVLAFNARGVGRSGGSKPWLVGLGPDAEDFAAVERWGIEVLGLGGSLQRVLRFGYSFGTLSAVVASPPPTPSLQSILLVSPPLTIFRLTAFFSASFTAHVRRHLSSSTTKVWIVHGTKDDFTGNGAYGSLDRELEGVGLVTRRIDGADHFYTAAEDGVGLQRVMRDWLAA